MSFPATALPSLTELLIDGAWTAATVREESGVSITRGRANESGRVAASRCNLVLDNRSGDYSNRLPTAAYYGKLGRNTQLRHRIRWVRDTFDRTVSNGWGTSDTGQAWVSSGGSASDYAVGTGVGTHTLPTAAVTHASHFAMPVEATDLTASVSASAVATGDHFYEEVMFGLDGNNCYSAQLQLRTGGTAWLTLVKVVAGVAGTIVAATQVGTYAAGTQWSVRLQRNALGYVRAAAWLTADNPTSTTWTMTSPTPETELSDFSTGFLRSTSGPANTNVNPFFAWDNFEVNSYRFWGEVPSWPQVWDTTGADVTAPIEAAGIMRRLGGSTRPLRSAVYRTMAGVGPGDLQPYAYWPAEDGSGSTQIAAWRSDQSPMSISGSVTMAGDASIIGSDPLPVFAAGSGGSVAAPSRPSTSQWMFQSWMNIPSPLPGSNTDYLEVFATGTGARFVAGIEPSPLPAALHWQIYDSSGTQLDGGIFMLLDGSTGPSQADFFDHWWLWTIGAEDTGGGNTTYWLDCTNDANSFGFTQVVLTATPGTLTGHSIHGQGQSAGHFAYYDDTLDFGFYTQIRENAQALDGYTGETATDRMTRLCREEGIGFELVGDTADSAEMGPQRSGKLLDLLFECADADFGILYEPRDAFGLAYRTRPSLYNQTGLALDYAASQVFAPFAPVEDDQLIVNDATARRVNGSWARETTDSGPLSTADPPNGVGTYDEDRTYNVAADEQLSSIAGWRIHVGSWDEARYPQVHVMLHAPAFSSSGALTGQTAAVDVGDYLSVDNPPAWLPPDLIELLAQGYREVHHTYEWDITWTCTPAGPYQVGAFGTARYDSDYTTTAEALDTTETGVDIAVTAGKAGWVTTAANAAEFPFNIMIGGELMTVTASSSTGTDTYTLTVTRSVNGVVKSHATGAAVHVADPGYYAL